MSRSPSTIIPDIPRGDRVSCTSPGSQTAAWPGREPAYGPLRTGHLGLARQHDQQLATGSRVPTDGAARCERDGDQVGVGADAEGADREPAAAVGLDRAVGEVREVEDPHSGLGLVGGV